MMMHDDDDPFLVDEDDHGIPSQSKAATRETRIAIVSKIIRDVFPIILQ